MVDDRCRRRRAAARPVDELEAAVGAEEEADADVAAGLAAVLVVTGSIWRYSYVGPPAAWIAAISMFQVTEASVTAVFGRAVVVLDLLDREDVRRAEVVHDQVRVPRERAVGRVEVLDVVGPDDDLVIGRRPRHLAGQAAVDLGEDARDGDLVVGEVVGHHARSRGEPVGHVDHRRRDEEVVEHDPLRVEVAVLGSHPAWPDRRHGRGSRRAPCEPTRRRRCRRGPGSRRSRCAARRRPGCSPGRACSPGSRSSRSRPRPGRTCCSSRRCRWRSRSRSPRPARAPITVAGGSAEGPELCHAETR